MNQQQTIEPREIFKSACFLDKSEREAYVSGLIASRNLKLAANASFVKHNTLYYKGTECQYCKTDIPFEAFDYYAGYWTPFLWRQVHAECKKEAKDQEVFACQEIDMNCNDCKHLSRTSGGAGNCSKLNKPISFIPNTCSPQNHECFEHRKS